jgi:L-fuconolactonase
LATEANHDHWTIEDLRPFANHVIDSFGYDRLIYGSDWPVVTQASEYKRWFETASLFVREHSHNSEVVYKKIFHDNAKAYYKM